MILPSVYTFVLNNIPIQIKFQKWKKKSKDCSFGTKLYRISTDLIVTLQILKYMVFITHNLFFLKCIILSAAFLSLYIFLFRKICESYQKIVKNHQTIIPGILYISKANKKFWVLKIWIDVYVYHESFYHWIIPTLVWSLTEKKSIA